MKNAVFERQELCRRLGIEGKTLDEWQQCKIIGPFGFSDNHTPLFTESAVVDGEHIKRLRELGYDIKEIQKIIRKIGLPRFADRKNANEKKQKFLTVGVLAEKAGVSSRTIKHWEDVGIIEPNMRSQGGFRYYGDTYIYLCNLIKDLQLFGYSLVDIKMISDLFRYYLSIQQDPDSSPTVEKEAKLETMLLEIDRLFKKIALLKAGIGRWEDLLKRKKKEVAAARLETQKKVNSSKKGEPLAKNNFA
ncbi:MAG: MerR family transcriptional regulator [Acidobacteria bacterium]|nr:MerR family transcriptional regulator [Acidobacteriota bacterium]MBU4307283.1 MerR family transcriptional regulator [Acidobacteriota bacterium]MBU4405767.1 MerR family transcriptional regulator [Acidobacteriota bacterium]MCG2812475.1 MerR family transcriptional regulator [Candidatus Aminicenantes bacterium]